MCKHREDKVKVVFDKNAGEMERKWDIIWCSTGDRLCSFHEPDEAMEYAHHINSLETDVER